MVMGEWVRLVRVLSHKVPHHPGLGPRVREDGMEWFAGKRSQINWGIALEKSSPTTTTKDLDLLQRQRFYNPTTHRHEPLSISAS